MALEGIELNSGSGGQKIATDTVAGLDFQVVKIGVGADDATPTSVSAADPMPVDVLSLIPGTGAANLGKAVDDGAGATDTGVPPLAIRDDILTTLTPADGDYVPLRTSNVGSLWVDIHPGSNTFAKKVDDPAGGADKGVAVLAVRDDALSALVPIEGDYVHLRVNSIGALHVTGGGGGTEYSEDDATPSPIVGSATLIERDDVLSVVTPVQGDWIGLRGTAEGALWVQDFNSDAALAALQIIDDSVFVDDAAFSLGSSSVTVAGAIRDDALATLLAVEGDAVPLRVNSTGALHVTGAAGVTEFNEDAPAAGGEAGNLSLGVRRDANTTPVSADGDFHTMVFDATGNLKVDLVTALPAGTNAIGKLAVNSGVDIGDVTINNASGASAVNIQDGGNSITVDILNSTNTTASGALGAAEDTVILSSQGIGTVHWEIDTGTLVGTVVFEATLDGTNWFGVNMLRIGGGIVGSTVSFPDRGTFASTGYFQVRLRVSDFSSGTSNARMEGSLFHSNVVRLGQMLPSGNNNIGDVDVLTLPANASINLNQVGGSTVVTGGVAGSQGVGGLAADGAAVAGSPVLMAGSDGTNVETILVSASGKQCFMSSSAASDGSSNSIASPVVSATLSFKQAVSNFVFNGTTWDRLRGDTSGLHVSAQPARVSTTDTITAKLATDAIMDGTTSLTPKRALIVTTSSGDTVVVAGVGGKKIRVLSLAINAFGDANVEFQDAATGTSRSGLFDMGTSSGKAKGLVLAFSPVGHFETAVGVGLDINLSAAVTVEGHLVYVEV